MAHTLITLDDVKQFTKGGIPTSDFDYVLGKIIIPAVTRSFANYCKRDWDFAERSVYFSPRAGNKDLLLNFPPIATSPIVQLWQNLDLPRTYAAADLLVNGVDYFVNEKEGTIEHVSEFVGGPKTVKVTATGGYLTASGVCVADQDIADVRQAAIIQAKILFDRREELGVSSRSQEGGAVTMLSVLTLPRQVTITLDYYSLGK